MNSSILPIALAGIMIAVIHAAIPTHWLPFVIASRAQKWSWQKTQSVLLIAGLGHVIMTTLLGAIIFALGLGVLNKYHKYFILIACSSIGIYGCFQIFQYIRGNKHSHCEHTHDHNHFEDIQKTGQDGWAILSLLTLLTFSPCESFLPIYLSAIQHSWPGFVILSLILAIGTLTTMLLLTWISMKGLARFKMGWLEDNEKLVTGISLIILSVLVFFIEFHQH